jgi:hypothetical protein
MANLIAPVARQRVLTDLGVVAPGARLFTYVSGTPNTPLATTSDAAGLVPNTNPIVASAGGLFGPIYMPAGLAYHLVLQTTDGLPIWDQDPVTGPGSSLLPASLAPAFGVLTAGTTPTGPMQVVAPGAAGSILVSGGAAALPTWKANGGAGVSVLTDAPTVALDASLGTTFLLLSGGNRTIGLPTNPTPGQKILILHYANGAGPFTLTLTTSSAGGFRFNAAIPALTPTPSGQLDYIGCVYTVIGGGQTWDVVAYSKGYV